jgi:hypothetical protein
MTEDDKQTVHPAPLEPYQAIWKRPGMYGMDHELPFTTLRAFLAGYSVGRMHDKAALPDELTGWEKGQQFSKWVLAKLGVDQPGSMNWLGWIGLNYPGEQNAFDAVFQLYEEYKRQQSSTEESHNS